MAIRNTQFKNIITFLITYCLVKKKINANVKLIM